MITIDLDAYERWIHSLSGLERLGCALLSMAIVAAVIFFVLASIAIIVAMVETAQEIISERKDNK